MAEKADKLFTVRNQRLALQKQAEELQSVETALRAELIESIEKNNATGVSGQLVRVSVVHKRVPRATDWAALWKYIADTGSFDLMQRRLSDPAVKERWTDNQEVPGVEAVDVTDLSMNKV
jgi:hypothetical protein